jgi:type IV pilus assembly protein PilC
VKSVPERFKATSPGTPSSEALCIFFRSIATMFSAGVPLIRAMDLLGDQTEDPRMAAIARRIAHEIGSGHTLSRAFQVHRRAFTKLQLGLIRVGERTGQLQRVLYRLADYEEKRRGISMRVRSALTYPAFLLAITSFMLVVLPPYMFQGLFTMLESQSVELPLITKIVLAVSNFIRSPGFWILLIVGVVALALALPKFVNNPDAQMVVSKALVQVPVVGNLYTILATARFARAMELQLLVGEGPLTGLSVAAQASGTPILEESIVDSIDALKSGCSFVESLERADFFPPTFLSMLGAGEESASLPDVMQRTADMYEKELEYAISTFTDLLEPMIMLFMGILVGIVVVATMLPMVNLLQNF